MASLTLASGRYVFTGGCGKPSADFAARDIISLWAVSSLPVGTLPAMGISVPVSNGGGTPLPDITRCVHVSRRGDLLPMRPEFLFPGRNARSREVELAYLFPSDPRDQIRGPGSFQGIHLQGPFAVSGPPLPVRVGGASKSVVVSIPQSSHQVDSIVQVAWPNGSVEGQFHLSGGTNVAPSCVWMQPGYGAVRLGVPVHFKVQVQDLDQDVMGYEIRYNGIFVASGTLPPGTISEGDFIPPAGIGCFTITLTDNFGGLTVVPSPNVIVADDREPRGQFLLPPDGLRVRAGAPVTVRVVMSDPEMDGMGWKILDGSVVLASGNASIANAIEFSWFPSDGTHALALILSDQYGSGTPIAGPSVSAVPWRDLNCA